MGLLLSILVVCVGVLEAVSCFRHIQNGYLPFWLPNRLRPMVAEHARRKPSVEDDSSSSEEISRFLIDGQPIAHEASYGLTPILTEHRRNTPILRDEETDDEAIKYVENNVDESIISSSRSCHENSNLINEPFRPISPSPDPEEVRDNSLVTSSGKFVEVTETSERRVFPVTVCDTENESATTHGDIPNTNQISVSLNNDAITTLSQPTTEIEVTEALKTPIPCIDNKQYDDSQGLDDSPSSNLSQIVEIANKLVNEVINEASSRQHASLPQDQPDEPTIQTEFKKTTVDYNNSQNEKDDSELSQFHKPLLSFDLPLTTSASSSRPATPSTPRKVKAPDISWPVFHPDAPVIKRPSISLEYGSRLGLSRDPSIDEDMALDDEDLALDYDIDDGRDDGVEVNTDNPEEMLLLVSKGQSQSTTPTPLEFSMDDHIPSPEVHLDNSYTNSSTLLPASLAACPSSTLLVESLNYQMIEEFSSHPNDVIPSENKLNSVSEPITTIKNDAISQYPALSEPCQTDESENQISPNIIELDIISSSVLEPIIQSPTNNLSHSSDDLSRIPQVPDLVPDVSHVDTSPVVKFTELDIDVMEDYFSKVDASAALSTTPVINLSGESKQSSPYVQNDSATEVSEPPCKIAVSHSGKNIDMPMSDEQLLSIESMIESPSDVERAFVKSTTSDTERMVSLKDILFEPECKKREIYKLSTDNDNVGVVEEPDFLIRKNIDDSYSENVTKSELDFNEASNDAPGDNVDIAVLEPVCVSGTDTQTADVKDVQNTRIEAERVEDAVIQVPSEPKCTVTQDKDTSSEAATEPEVLVDTANQITPELEKEVTVEPKCVVTLGNDTNETVNEPDHVAALTSSTSNLSVNVQQKSLSLDSSDGQSFDEAGNEDSSESVSLGRDITYKESSIKRRKSYRDRKRNTTPKTSTEKIPEEVKEVKQEAVKVMAVEGDVTAKERDLRDLIDGLSCDEPVLESISKETDTKVEPIVIADKEVEPPVEAVDKEVQPAVVMRKKVTKNPEEETETKKEDIVRRRESATEGILNKDLLPVEILHSGETNVESAVFATKREEPKKKLKKPARADSFEDAHTHEPKHSEMTKPRRTTEDDKNIEKRDSEVVKATEPKDNATNKSSLTEQSPKLADPNAKRDNDSQKTSDVTSDETTPNDDDSAEGAEGAEANTEECSVSESDASNVKQPIQSSNPAFWLIFSGEYTKAMSKDWHSGHFCCWQCDESLTGQRYVLRDDHPYCIKCYESVFANMCEECNKTIGIDSKDLSYKDKHWHEACFLCNKCRVSLVDKQFGSKADKIYCGNCYDSQFASRCDGCGEIFRAGTKKMEYKTRQWHEKCFCCCVCKSAIGTKSFIPREQEIYCATCYEEKFATRCVKCNKIITSGGVTYKNEPWHRECFTCTHCSTSLAGQRFTSRDEKPYCAECFGELFAKRCTACVKPITGIGGTRFISFEDRHWHNDCFICATCKASLVGRGFITDADDIICPECAKQKLM